MSIMIPIGVIATANQSSVNCCVIFEGRKSGFKDKSANASRHAERLASRMSDRSSQTKFWYNKHKNDTETQSRGKFGTAMKDAKVLTTASRTLGIVCRKKGKSVGARVERGNLTDVQRKSERNKIGTYETVSQARMLITFS